MNLSQTRKHIKYIIKSINAPDEVIQTRFFQLGFNEGSLIYLKRKAPIFGDPMLFEIGESQVALTKAEACFIEVVVEE